jgi:hypothetical protein
MQGGIPQLAPAGVPRRGVGQDGSASASGSASVQIQSVLGGLPGVSATQVNQAVAAYTGLDAATTGSLLSILQGGPVNATTLGPVIASGMALLGASAPAIAAVAIGLSVLSDFTELFAPSAPKCAWSVRGLCFNQTRPSGPGDPAWVSWAAFTASTPQMLLNQAYPWYYVMQCDEGAIGSLPPPLSPELQFLQVYYAAWKANAEYAINGYASIDECELLGIVAKAWNAGHTNDSVYTFLPTPPFGLQPAGTVLSTSPACPGDQNLPPFVPGTPPSARSYVGLLMDGDVTGTRCTAQGLSINTGPVLVSAAGNIALAQSLSNVKPPGRGGANGAPATSSPASSAILTTAGLAAAAALGGVGIYALVTRQAYGAAWKKVWQKTGGAAWRRLHHA